MRSRINTGLLQNEAYCTRWSRPSSPFLTIFELTAQLRRLSWRINLVLGESDYERFEEQRLRASIAFFGA